MSDDEQKQDQPPIPDPNQSQDDQALKDLLNDLSQEPPEEELQEAPDPKQLQPMPAPASPAPVTTIEQQQITEYAKKFGEVSNEILNNYKADRDQINDTIEYLENLVFNATGERVHVEMLVAALRTKAETNASAVKLLDSLAKFLAATKGTNVFVQNNNTTIQDDLRQILSKAPYLDEVKNAKN